MTRIHKYDGRSLNYRDSQKLAKKLQNKSGVSDKQRRKLDLKHVGWMNLIRAIEHYDKRIASFVVLSDSQTEMIKEDTPELAEAIEEFMAIAMKLELDLQSLSDDIPKPKYTTDGSLIVINQKG